jgi:hypothetical protein
LLQQAIADFENIEYGLEVVKQNKRAKLNSWFCISVCEDAYAEVRLASRTSHRRLRIDL